MRFFPNNFNLLHPVEWPAILIRTSSERHVWWLLASRPYSNFRKNYWVFSGDACVNFFLRGKSDLDYERATLFIL
jgi:hypothetical protein